jgi:hypothetical protein
VATVSLQSIHTQSRSTSVGPGTSVDTVNVARIGLEAAAVGLHHLVDTLPSWERQVSQGGGSIALDILSTSLQQDVELADSRI